MEAFAQNYTKGFVHQRVKRPNDDLISSLIEGPYTQGKLTEEDIVNLAFLVLADGNAALINSIVLGIVTLQLHPQQLKELKKNPKLVKDVVGELTRCHTASALNSRRAVKRDTEIGGHVSLLAPLGRSIV